MRIFAGFKESDQLLASEIINELGEVVYPIYWPKKRTIKVEDINLFPTDIGKDQDFYIHYSGYQKISTKLLGFFPNRALNLHPAPPWFRGSGGLNHAIYREELKFGLTFHHMSSEYDDGKIIKIYDFQILSDENIIEATKRINSFRKDVFKEILLNLKDQNKDNLFLSSAKEINWQGHLYKISDIDDLSTIDSFEKEVSFDEINKRIKAFATKDFPIKLKTKYGTYKIYGIE